MANKEQLAVAKKGVDVWNAWRKGEPTKRFDLRNADLTRVDFKEADLNGTDLCYADLSYADLSYAALIDADLSEADLTGVDLTDAILINANLTRADLRAANLTGADLSSADLTDADLTRADLSGAVLREAKLSWPVLNGANLGGAKLGYTILADVDLSSVQGLDSVDHLGPSTIGIDTLYRSHGNIPEVFLRDAGVPNALITYAKSLVGSAIEFYSCFISYATNDQQFADRLHADLQNKGVRCWFAPHDIRGGRKIHEQIDEAIRIYDKLLLILSPASMNSNWVKTEIANARNREEEQKRQMLFPVAVVPFEQVRAWKCFDADIGIDTAREVREYFIPDFSNWKDHDSYQEAFSRLLKDLQAKSENAASINVT